MKIPASRSGTALVVLPLTLLCLELLSPGVQSAGPPAQGRSPADRVIEFTVAPPRIAAGPTYPEPPDRPRRRHVPTHGRAPYELIPAPEGAKAADSAETFVSATASETALTPTDVVVQRNTEFAQGPFGHQSQINEPSVGSAGHALFQTTNWSAMRSVDNGATWAHVDPYTQFPTNPFPFNAGFCCDQRVAQDTRRGMILWYLMYIPTGEGPNDTNGVRLAVARSAADVATNTWAYWDFTPGTFGLTAPGSAAGLGYWFDFPHMEVTDNFVWITSNYFRTTGVFAGAIVFRVPLQALKDGTSITSQAYITQSFASISTVHGGSSTAFFGSRTGANSMKVIRWPEANTTPTVQDVVGLSTTFTGFMDCIGPDFLNPCGRSDTRIQTGWLTPTELGFMWNSTQNAAAGRPYPFTRFVVLNPGSLAVLQDSDIYSTTSAYLYPAVSVSARGGIGGVIDHMGGNIYPTMTLMLRDDVSGPSFQLAGVGPVSVAGADGDSQGGGWGDFNGSQPHSRYPRTWLVGAHVQLISTLNNDQSDSRNIWFGRQRDVVSRIAADFNGDGRSDLAVFRDGIFTIESLPPVALGAAGDLSVPGDYDGDAIVDLATFRAGTWTIRFSATQTVSTIGLGAAGDVPVPADYNGDHITNIAVFRPSTGEWFLRPAAGGPPVVLYLGGPGDTPVPADYDGDGVADLAVFRRASGTWFVAAGGNVTTIPFGATGDIPLAADYDGNGVADLAVWRPWTGTWYVRNIASVVLGAAGDIPLSLDTDGDGRSELVAYRRATGQWLIRNLRTGSTTTTAFGTAGDLPIARPPAVPLNLAGDFEGDYRADVAVFRPSTGQWFAALSSTGLTRSDAFGSSSDIPVPGDFRGSMASQFAIYRPSNGGWFINGGPTVPLGGQPDDVPLRADTDGDGRQDPAVYRASTSTFFALASSADYSQASLTAVVFGTGGDRPVTGDYDGDGRTDFAVFRPSTAQWFVRYSSTGAVAWTVLGVGTDIKIPRDYDGDGRDDVAVYTPATGVWRYISSATGAETSFGFGGAPGDVPVPSDYDGDGRADPAIARDNAGVISWYVRNLFAVVFGNSGDVPVLQVPQ